MIHQLLGAVIIVVAGFIAGLIYQKDVSDLNKDNHFCVQLTPAQQLIRLIEDDFLKLKKENRLPKEWNSAVQAEFKINSELARMILGKSRPVFSNTKSSKYYLELDLLDLPDEENPGIIIQASLFESKSKNKIFEIGRTYTMNDLNKITEKTALKKKTAN